MLKNILYIVLTTAILSGCKQTTENASPDNLNGLSTPEAIAHAYGYSNWDAVNEIGFTFNVDHANGHTQRSFVWKPKTDVVTYIQDSVQLTYQRGGELDSLQTAADKRFINDKYWLLVPFQLLWDPSLSFTEQNNIQAPISKDTLNLLTLVYPDEGGYTPGDAYDLYYNTDYQVMEWAFRKGNRKTPNLVMTWENTETHNGLHFATMHQDSLQQTKIYFTNLHVE